VLAFRCDVGGWRIELHHDGINDGSVVTLTTPRGELSSPMAPESVEALAEALTIASGAARLNRGIGRRP
jgi:hypothetical protein